MLKNTIAILLLIPTTLFAQVDSTKIQYKPKHSIAKALILPTSLGVAGIIVKESTVRENFKNYLQTSKWRTNTTIDNYIQYAPMAEMYIADISISKSKQQIFQQSKNLIISQLFTAIIVQTLKITTQVTRPNGAAHSFPSGHTSVAFTGATALYLEYRDTNPFVAYSGYGFSTATGILRMTNNKHWLSDVLVGAGIGMLSAQLTWYINPLKNWNPYKNSKVVVYPFINAIDASAGFCMTF